ncbi:MULTISPECIES: ergothioneine biosynthesis protein EgtB [unclassified Dietzia]|uniref:ergothioneine biosynthesis protein EgtB n=1 Tax=unclassified Dietzia TaxID=2617939 RepID=UPI000D21B348|nr:MULTISPECIES: ergothioneine biosynthesis protein EgtB [unclassified Dietzia]AVZ40433.1 ergothioneine biosynthesis protein EgtB [Dietzia sp. JS16-p6b]QGW25946.1 hypothetical protein GJR88_04486 [Dietzia sp. DQ12-45-1b]
MTVGDVTTQGPQSVPTLSAGGTVERFLRVRQLTDLLASRLSAEDQIPQSMTAASPAAWHRAHTTWFFEEFVLGRLPGYTSPEPVFRFLFNSYYEAVGPRQPRPQRGLITRPSVAEIGDFRSRVDEAVVAALEAGRVDDRGRELLELGCHHEQQHQELMLMDAKHLFSHNPTDPVYVHRSADPVAAAPGETDWLDVVEGVARVGAADPADRSGSPHDDLPSGGFSYDNERPRHRVWIPGGQVAGRQVTVADWKQFMADGGYSRPELWLSDGWAAVQTEGWDAPGYWRREDGIGAPAATDGNASADGDWTTFTLSGRRPVVDAEPVCHVSFYEADAFARWAGARLPTEFEWEVASAGWRIGDELDPDRCHPRPATDRSIGGVWEWTSSAYLPYPGFVTEEGAAGEYNGKFMSDQHVLRGGSALTPAGHTRPTYRNFFPASSRWAATGLRLAR